jgi:hypothetical protein
MSNRARGKESGGVARASRPLPDPAVPESARKRRGTGSGSPGSRRLRKPPPSGPVRHPHHVPTPNRRGR